MNMYRQFTRACCCFTLPILLLYCSLVHGQQTVEQFALVNGDRVVFYGDSITNQKLYTSDIENYILTRFPELNISFTTSGVDGDKVTGGYAGPIDLRLERDVIAHHPTVVTVMLGMNDGYYVPYDAQIFAAYAEGYHHLVDVIQSKLPGVRLVLLRPSPYDDVTPTRTKPEWHEGMAEAGFEDGYNGVLQRFGAFVAKLATEKHANSVDLNRPIVSALEKGQQLDPALAATLIADRVHPGAGVQWLMAQTILKAWNAPAIVTAVQIDGARPAVLSTRNTTVTGLHRSGDRLLWTQTDRALPLPFPSAQADPFVALAMRSSDLVESLDQQILKVSNLPKSSYRLEIDNKLVGTFPVEQVSSGINIAVLETSMLEQSRRVAFDTERKNEIDNARFTLALQSLQGMERASSARRRSEEALEKAHDRAAEQQRRDAHPVSHVYMLERIPPSRRVR